MYTDSPGSSTVAVARHVSFPHITCTFIALYKSAFNFNVRERW